MFGAVETGGTKIICAVLDADGKIGSEARIPTETPEKTMPAVIRFFREHPVRSLGIGSFGPLDLHPDSATYGYITSTPKPGWRNYPLLPVLRDALKIPAAIDTDVNAALLGEAAYGAAKGLQNAVYLTIGTGIGGGVMTDGKLLHGMLHPELGHMPLARRRDDGFNGICPYHGCCFEGLASGPAIAARWGKPAEELYERTEVWDLEAFYIAEALTSYIMVLSPERIILGGGVMHCAELFPLIRKKTEAMLNGYINTKELDSMDSYIVPSSLHDRQGILGCLQLAMHAAEEDK